MTSLVPSIPIILLSACTITIKAGVETKKHIKIKQNITNKIRKSPSIINTLDRPSRRRWSTHNLEEEEEDENELTHQQQQKKSKRI